MTAPLNRPRQLDAHPRFVAFPNGSVSELPPEAPSIAELRRTDKRFAHVLDVTPRRSSVAVHLALGLSPWWVLPMTSLIFRPCPDCAAGDAAKWLVCETCGGTRRVPVWAAP